MLRHKVLSRADQDALLGKYRELADLHGAESREALRVRDTILVHNLKLAAMMANRFKRLPAGVEKSDLISWGAMGLCMAVSRFDLSRNVQFSTYALWWIRHAIQRALADLGTTIRVPVHAQDALRRDVAGTADERTQRTLNAARNARSVVSLNAPIADDDYSSSSELGERVADDEASSVLDRMEHEQDVERVTAAVARLPQRHRAIVRARMEGATLKEVGLGLDDGRSRERVRQMEAEALDILRRELRSA